MASGDIIFSSIAYPQTGSWGVNSTATIDFELKSEVASNLDQGDLHLVARVDAPPYGQGWPDAHSPFVPGKTYRVTITEL